MSKYYWWVQLCNHGYTGHATYGCVDIDECELGGMYACSPDTIGTADKACINMPGTFECVDSAVISGGYYGGYNFLMVKAASRDYYYNSILKCANHGLPPLPARRYHHKMAYVGDYLFICGGYQSGRRSECYKLNLWTKQYEPMAHMNRIRSHFNLNHANGKLYTTGGYSNSAVVPESAGYNCDRQVEEYDIDANTWTQTNAWYPHGHGVHRQCTVNVGFYLYVIGGHHCSGTWDRVYRFDTLAKQWVHLNSVRWTVYDHSCESLYLKDGTHIIMVAGGHTSLGRDQRVQYMRLSDPGGGWIESPSLGTPWAETPHLAYVGR
jgi:hypothetical protein